MSNADPALRDPSAPCAPIIQVEDDRTSYSPEGFRRGILDHLNYSMGKDDAHATQYDRYMALAHAVRAHWAVENRLHWTLDVSFGEDASTLRTDHAPQNLSLLRKMALNIIRANKADTRKASLRLKRKGAAWDDDLRMNMLRIKPLC